MTAAAARIVSGPVDPDLERELPHLAMRAKRLRQIESIMRLPDQRYSQSAAMRTERAEIYTYFAEKAERLAIRGDRPGRALLLLTEEADRLYVASKRRPTLAQVLTGLRAVTAVADRDLSTAECDLLEAKARVTDARVRAASGADAIGYLEACR